MVMMIMTAAALVIVVMMMLMVVIMAAATLVIMVVVMMLMLLVVIVAAAALAVMVVVMMFMFVLIMIVMMVLMLLIVVMAAAALIVVMMMVMMLFYLRKVDDGTFHRIEYFLTTQYFNRCGNNVCFRIQLAEHFYSCLYFFRIGFIGTAQDDGSCALNLVLEKFAEVSEIHFAFHNVNYGCCGIQGYACFFFYTVYSLDDVGKFTYAGRLDDDAVRVIFGDNVF
mgnify:CR=1 FL=1